MGRLGSVKKVTILLHEIFPLTLLLHPPEIHLMSLLKMMKKKTMIMKQVKKTILNKIRQAVQSSTIMKTGSKLKKIQPQQHLRLRSLQLVMVAYSDSHLNISSVYVFKDLLKSHFLRKKPTKNTEKNALSAFFAKLYLCQKLVNHANHCEQR